VDVVVSARGGMPGQALLDEVQAHLSAIREIAVDVQVIPPTAAEVALSIAVTPEAGASFNEVAAKVTAAVEGWFTGDLLGRGVPQAAITALVFGVEGVANCAVTLSGGDVAADPVTLPCLGSLAVTEG
jgi:phage-related baseplate assembly protein